MNQRIVYAIAKEVAVDLLGARETQHIRCASGPFVASSRVPVCRDVQWEDFTRQRRLSSSCCHRPRTQFLRGGLFSLHWGCPDASFPIRCYLPGLFHFAIARRFLRRDSCCLLFAAWANGGRIANDAVCRFTAAFQFHSQ